MCSTIENTENNLEGFLQTIQKKTTKKYVNMAEMTKGCMPKASKMVQMFQQVKLQLSEEEYTQLYEESQLSLQKRLQPKTLDAFIGQLDVVGENGSISHYLNDKNINKLPSMLLWGPPGIGKTSLANILLNRTTLLSFKFSATTDSITDIKPVIAKLKNERKLAVLFIDEIHRFSKTQQTFLLDAIDSGFVTLIGATTENPSFNLIKPLTSRCLTVCLHPHNLQEIKSILMEGIRKLNETRIYVHQFPRFMFSDEAIEYIAKVSNGDLRNALKLLEISFVLCTDFDPKTHQVVDSEPFFNNIAMDSQDEPNQESDDLALSQLINNYDKLLQSLISKAEDGLSSKNGKVKLEKLTPDNSLQDLMPGQKVARNSPNNENIFDSLTNSQPSLTRDYSVKPIIEKNEINNPSRKLDLQPIDYGLEENILDTLDNPQACIVGNGEASPDHDGNLNDIWSHYPSVFVTKEKLESIVALNYVNFDTKGDSHYDTISAFHKSIRGSDCDASLYYLMRMIYGGDDPLYVCRRMVRIASEDIGIIDNTMFEYCCDVYQAVERMGMPKCINLMAQCAVRLAKLPKSVVIYRGWNDLKAKVASNRDLQGLVPKKLMTSNSKIMNRFIGTDIQFEDLSSTEYMNKDDNEEIDFDELMPEKLKGFTFIHENQHLGTAIDEDIGIPWSDSEDEFRDENYYNEIDEKNNQLTAR